MVKYIATIVYVDFLATRYDFINFFVLKLSKNRQMYQSNVTAGYKCSNDFV